MTRLEDLKAQMEAAHLAWQRAVATYASACAFAIAYATANDKGMASKEAATAAHTAATEAYKTTRGIVVPMDPAYEKIVARADEAAAKSAGEAAAAVDYAAAQAISEVKP